MTGLREKNKARRRGAILDAALTLLRDEAMASVTIERIASRAGVSPPTVYNLVGTREQLWVALVERVVDDLVASLADLTADEDPDPIGRALAAVDSTVAAFVSESGAFRQIARSLGEFSASGSRVSFDPVQIHVWAMRRAQELGVLRPDLDPEALGRQSYLTYVAALNGWAAGGLSDRGFRIAARHGLLTVVVSAVSEGHRERYLEELRQVSSRFAKVAWNAEATGR
ncbi:MAG: TetR/AcrR family transcriptional regulator [Myxococcota bacterium]